MHLFQREAYPLGFFVALVVKEDDTDCNGSSISNPLRTKNVTLVINPTITKRDYIIASVSAAGIILFFCIFYVTVVIIFKIREGRTCEEPINDQSQDVNAPSPSMVGEVSRANILAVMYIRKSIYF